MIKTAILASAVLMGLAAVPVLWADEAWTMKVAMGGKANEELKAVGPQPSTRLHEGDGERPREGHQRLQLISHFRESSSSMIFLKTSNG